MLQSNTSFTLLSKINITDTTGGTFTISNENENDTPIDTDWEQVSIVFSNKRQRERFIVTIVNNVCTIVSRGLSQKWGAESTTLQKQWLEGTVWYMTALDFDIFEKDSGETQIVSADTQFTGALSTIWDFSASDIRFTGTTTSWLRTKSLTTTQRIALTAENGDLVYDTDLWELYQYVWGAWSAVSAGSTQANASTTVAGKVELATAAERATWTAIGWTGATLVPTNDALVKTSSGASDENKIPVLNSNGKIDAFVTKTSEKTEATTISDTDIISINDSYKSSISTLKNQVQKTQYSWVIASDTIRASADTERTSPVIAAWMKVKEIQIPKLYREGGSVRLTVDAKRTTTDKGNLGFYKNWVQLDVRNPTTTYANYSYDMSVSWWDLVQIYYEFETTNWYVSVKNFKVKYDEVEYTKTPIVNQD